jgi:hypothetical protein
MAQKNLAPRSINDQGESRCVDIFKRPDATYEFEAYRRDPEDDRGWFPDGGFGDQVFATEDQALVSARTKVSWLNEALRNGFRPQHGSTAQPIIPPAELHCAGVEYGYTGLENSMLSGSRGKSVPKRSVCSTG